MNFNNVQYVVKHIPTGNLDLLTQTLFSDAFEYVEFIYGKDFRKDYVICVLQEIAA